MKRYTVAQVRARLAEALDSAEQGEAVVVERRGVRFRLTAVEPPRRAGKRPQLIARVDPAVDAGSWTWSWDEDGLAFGRTGGKR